MSVSPSVVHLPQFSIKGYETWSFHLECYLSSVHDRMWEVVTERPITVMKVNTVPVPAMDGGEATTRNVYVEKPKEEYCQNDFRVANLDRVARHIMQSTVSDAYLPLSINNAHEHGEEIYSSTWSELLYKHHDLLRSHEVLQQARTKSKSENKKLVAELDLVNLNLRAMTGKFEDLFARHKSLEEKYHTQSILVANLNKASQARQALEGSLPPFGRKAGLGYKGGNSKPTVFVSASSTHPSVVLEKLTAPKATTDKEKGEIETPKGNLIKVPDSD